MTTAEPPEPVSARSIATGWRRSFVRRAVQLVVFCACVGVLVWLVHHALTDPGNRPQLERLSAAAPGDVAVLVACSLVTTIVGGLVFRAVLTPERRLRRVDCVAVNGVVSVISYLPFKVGLAFRVWWHHSRDG